MAIVAGIISLADSLFGIRSHLISKRRFFFGAYVLVILCLLYEGYWANTSLDSIPPTAPVVIRWSTRREEKTAGYLLYRSENSAGPFRQINSELVPAVNDPYLGGMYVYTDTETTAGVTYYYELEDVALDGQRSRQEPISITARSTNPTILGWNAFDRSTLIFVIAVALVLLFGRIRIFLT